MEERNQPLLICVYLGLSVVKNCLSVSLLVLPGPEQCKANENEQPEECDDDEELDSEADEAD